MWNDIYFLLFLTVIGSGSSRTWAKTEILLKNTFFRKFVEILLDYTPAVRMLQYSSTGDSAHCMGPSERKRETSAASLRRSSVNQHKTAAYNDVIATKTLIGYFFNYSSAKESQRLLVSLHNFRFFLLKSSSAAVAQQRYAVFLFQLHTNRLITDNSLLLCTMYDCNFTITNIVTP